MPPVRLEDPPERPPHISGPILANLPIFGSTWPACFVTGRAKDACFLPRWLGNGQQGTARWPTTTPVLTGRLTGSHRAPGTRCTDRPAPTGTSKSRDIPPSRRCQTRPFTKIQKTALRLNFLLQTHQSHHLASRLHSQWLLRLLAFQRPSYDISAFSSLHLHLHLRCADALLADWRLALPPWDDSLPKVPPTTLASSPTHRYRQLQLQLRKPDKENAPCKDPTHE